MVVCATHRLLLQQMQDDNGVADLAEGMKDLHQVGTRREIRRRGCQSLKIQWTLGMCLCRRLVS